MEIILLEKIQNVGDIGDLVSVRNGYARNFLIPQKKAMLATTEAKANFEEKRKQLAEEESGRLQTARARAEQAVREISLTRLCGEEGQLYGSVSPIDIAEAITAAGTEIEKSEVTQPDGPIKHTGDFEADVILHPEVRFTVKIHVQGEESEDPGFTVEEEPVPEPVTVGDEISADPGSDESAPVETEENTESGDAT